MEESDTYQPIIDEGRLRQARQNILLIAGECLELPSDAVRQRILDMTDLEHMNRLLLAAIQADSWEQLLQTP